MTDVDPRLDRLRGSLPRASANARSVAALTENPGCSRRRIVDAAGLKAHELADRLGHPTLRGQSPFAIETGNRFEDRLKKRSGYALLVEALAPFVDLPAPPDLNVEDVNSVGRLADAQTWMEARVAKTDEALARIARGGADAPHVVDHPVLRLDLTGSSVNLEPDALAFRVGDRLELVEIKSYAVIDGQADPAKVSATAAQSAVYHMALRATLERLGFDPELLAWSVILVAPRNFGRTPTAHRIPLRKKSAALARVLGSVPRVGELLDDLPHDLSFDVGSTNTDSRAASEALNVVVSAIDALYVPECVQNCDMAKFCRSEAWSNDDPSRVGRTARDSLAGVSSLSEALALARSANATDGSDAEVGGALRDAFGALERARARSGDQSLLSRTVTDGPR